MIKHGGNLRWAAQRFGVGAAEIIDFSASINPLGTPLGAIAAIQNHFATLQHYPDPEYVELRSALAQFHDLAPDWVLAGNGVAELLTWVGRDLAALTTTVVLTPAFADYYRALNSFGGKISEFKLNLAKYEGLPTLVGDKNSGLLINNPHNPTGYLFSRASIEQHLGQFALVVVDEAFMDFLPPQDQQSLIDLVPNHPNLVILRSLTKFYALPGLRLGYAIAHPDRLQKWQRWRDPWSVNSLAVAAGLAILADREFQAKTWAWLPNARSQLWQGMAVLDGLDPIMGAANFLLVRSSYAGTWLQAQLLQGDRLLIRDCQSFKELGDRYFRVAVRLEAENQLLIAGLAQIIHNHTQAHQH